MNTESQPPHSALGALIRQTRDGQKLSMEEVALRSNVGRSTLHRIENAHPTCPNANTVARVLTTLSITERQMRQVYPEPYADRVARFMQPEVDSTADAPPVLIAVDIETGTLVEMTFHGPNSGDGLLDVASVLKRADYQVALPA